MQRRRQVDRAVAIARGADELRTLGACQQQLQPLGRQRLIIGNQDAQRISFGHLVSTGIVSDTLYPPLVIGP